MRIDGGEILVRTLLANGVRHVFTLHGGHLDAVHQAARGTALRFVDTRHEQAAGRAADGYARTNGRTGAATATGHGRCARRDGVRGGDGSRRVATPYYGALEEA